MITYPPRRRHGSQAGLRRQGPFFGVQPAPGGLGDGKVIERRPRQRATSSSTAPWPGQIRTVYGDHQRVIDTYYATHKGFYFTGDGARRDADGYYWITGRVDDVMNISGHRMGTAEVGKRARTARGGRRGRGRRLSAPDQG